MLVSWSRLIAGDVFNPLVARDVLIGAAVMAVAYSLDLSGMLLAQRVTGVLPLLDSSPRPFMGGLHIVSEVAVAAAWAVVLGILFLLLYYIVRRVVRFEWAAVIVGAMLIRPASGVIGSGGALVRLPFEFVFLAAMLVVLARVGLVAIIAVSGHVATDAVVLDDRCDWPHALDGGGLHRVPDRHPGAGAPDP